MCCSQVLSVHLVVYIVGGGAGILDIVRVDWLVAGAGPDVWPLL